MDNHKFIYLPATDSVIATYLVADNLGLTKDTDKMRKVYRTILDDFGVNPSFLDEDGRIPDIAIVPFEEWSKDMAQQEEEAVELRETKEEAQPEAGVQLREKPKATKLKAEPEKKPQKKEATKPEPKTAPKTAPKTEGRKTDTLSALMEKHHVKMSGESFRTIMTTKGLLEIVAIPGSAGRIYRKLTDEGLIYGKNLRKDDGYKVRYYEDMFGELVKLVRDAQDKGK